METADRRALAASFSVTIDEPGPARTAHPHVSSTSTPTLIAPKCSAASRPDVDALGRIAAELRAIVRGDFAPLDFP
jgi:hypothetical protein